MDPSDVCVMSWRSAHQKQHVIMLAGDAETERNLIQLDESVEAVEYLAEPLQVSVSAVSVPLAEKVGNNPRTPSSLCASAVHSCHVPPH